MQIGNRFSAWLVAVLTVGAVAIAAEPALRPRVIVLEGVEAFTLSPDGRCALGRSAQVDGPAV